MDNPAFENDKKGGLNHVYENDPVATNGVRLGFSSSADTTKGPDGDLPTTPDGIKKEKRRIMKNIVLISLAFLFNFTAFQGLSRLQSSLHRDDGMGVVNLSILYGALVLSCLLIPKMLIRAIGHKWTIPLSFIGYILWMAANGYAVWGTMATASILVGLSAAPLWTAQCSYFTKIAHRYAKLTGDKEEAVVARFFGIFFMFFQLSGITGSIITSTVLKPKSNPTENDTLSVEEIRMFCGIRDCPDNNISYNSNLDQPDTTTVWTMLGIFIGVGAFAVLIVCIWVNRLPKSLRDDKSRAKKEICDSLLNTVKHLRIPEQCILIPITMYSGFEQAFFGAEWTGSFVSCSIGIWKVGLVTLPFGVVNTIMSFTTGHIVKYTGRVPIFTLGLLVDLSIQFTLIFWPLNKQKEYVFYIISGLWGLTDGIWQTQINALYGSLFAKNSEAAFANYRMWESVGFIIAFAYSAFVCTSVKLYVLMSVLVVGMIGYYIVEWMNRGQHGININTDDSHGKEAQGEVATHTQESVFTTGDYKKFDTHF